MYILSERNDLNIKKKATYTGSLLIPFGSVNYPFRAISIAVFN